LLSLLLTAVRSRSIHLFTAVVVLSIVLLLLLLLLFVVGLPITMLRCRNEIRRFGRRVLVPRSIFNYYCGTGNDDGSVELEVHEVLTSGRQNMHRRFVIQVNDANSIDLK
jgi:hypothetical protein